jgi:hypothetical protein
LEVSKSRLIAPMRSPLETGGLDSAERGSRSTTDCQQRRLAADLTNFVYRLAKSGELQLRLSLNKLQTLKSP